MEAGARSPFVCFPQFSPPHSLPPLRTAASLFRPSGAGGGTADARKLQDLPSHPFAFWWPSQPRRPPGRACTLLPDAVLGSGDARKGINKLPASRVPSVQPKYNPTAGAAVERGGRGRFRRVTARSPRRRGRAHRRLFQLQEKDDSGQLLPVLPNPPREGIGPEVSRGGISGGFTAAPPGHFPAPNLVSNEAA